MLKEIAAFCSTVPVYPVASRLRTVVVTVIDDIPTPLLASKQTSSVDTGTEKLFAPPEPFDQFVGPVAAQVLAEPPPTQ